MKKKHAGGRPLKLGAKEKLSILELAKFGLTDAQMALALGFTKQTLDGHKKKDPKFFVSLKENKELADSLVQKSLLGRALGGEYEEEYPTKDGAVMCKKVLHPDVTACIFWLKNRKAREWKDKHEHDLGDGAVQGIAALFRGRYESETARLATGEDPEMVLFGKPNGKHTNGTNGNGKH